MAISGIALGILLAFVAMIGWGFGDFWIQKSARKIGDWETLFFISIIGVIIVTPLIWSQIPFFLMNVWNVLLLLLISVLLLAAALLDFESLREGKIAIIEPIYALEIPVAGILAFLILNETINPLQIALIGGIIAGLMLVSLKRLNIKKKHLVERGVFVAIIGTIFMGAVSFGFGYGSRATSALMTNWFTDLFLVIFTIAYIIYKKRDKLLKFHLRNHKIEILRMSLADKLGWVSFAFAAVLAPISIVVPISQGYIIVTVLLGVFVNREKLHQHQVIGLIVAIACALVLAASII